MNQIKYLIKAFLILCCLAAEFYFLKTLNSTQIIESNTSVIIDYIDTEPTVSASSNGKKLFQQNCQSCHALDKRLTGPALRGFTQRGPWDNKENIYKWIKNPAAFMKKDSYTKSLQTEYGIVMQSFPDLTKEEVDEIIAYITEMPGYY